MIGTAFRQFSIALSLALGRPINLTHLRGLIRDALDTIEELGDPEDDMLSILSGTLADPVSLHDLQDYTLQRTLRNLLRHSPYYQKRLASLPFAPGSLTHENLHLLPLTTKSDLISHEPDFLATNARPLLSTRTTGTTGIPAQIWLSRYEVELWSALLGVATVVNKLFDPQGCFQINLSLRATGLILGHIAYNEFLGTRVHAPGIIPVNSSLDYLLRGDSLAPTMLATYTSYLAMLTVAARRRGLQPSDFRLRHIFVGSEVLSSTLSRAVEETFGCTPMEGYDMTEIAPASCMVCNQGHLHPSVATGFFEVIGLESMEPAAPGELGRFVVTPYYPYRLTMPILRYDTRDVVQRLPDGPLTCDQSQMPAFSHVQGKADHLTWFDGQIVTTRALVEAIESLPSQPWPARFRAHPTACGIELHLAEQAFDGLTEGDMLEHFRQAGIPVCTLRRVATQDAPGLRRLRGDLIEPSF